MPEGKTVQVIMPVHNEAATIEKTIMDIYNEINPHLPMEFIICEDGSTDGTKEILSDLEKKVPMRLIMSDERKGYSRAFIDGFKEAQARYILTLDSDGQCVPSDFWSLYENIQGSDVVIGWRVDRADSLLRHVMSRSFKFLHRLLFRIPLHDPSCPFLLIKKEALESILPELGVLKQGFWWEFTARIYKKGYKITEVPVQHRLRDGGGTRVYKLHKIPGIATAHILGLFKIWNQTRRPKT